MSASRLHRAMLFILLLVTVVVPAQEFLYDVDFVMNFDDRESHDTYDISQTIFGVRLTPTVGCGLVDSLGGHHMFMAGATYIQPFGSKWRDAKVVPTVYYRFDIKGFQMNVGFVPYIDLLDPLPDYLRSDSLAFAYPNIQGALFQYQSKWGRAELFCDWRGMMSKDTREAFRIVGGGRFNYLWFYTGGWIQMNHLSHSDSIMGVCDDVVFNPILGANLSAYTPLDSLSVQAGYICGWQRDRAAHNNHWEHGFHASVCLGWRFIGFRNELYVGHNQMPLYKQYGTLLNQGDPHYQASLYNRTDIFFYLVRRSFVTCYAGWSFLVTDKGVLSHQPQLCCRFNLDGLKDNQKKQIRTLSWR